MADLEDPTSWAISVDEVIQAVEADDNLGLCISCGCEADGCEPDARGYECPECEQMTVYGAEELMFHCVG